MFAVTVLVASNLVARPQDADKGKDEFLTICARCHGADAKGAGPDSIGLTTKPADLTALANRNNGLFDPGAVYQMIDGRHIRTKDRSPDMPIWGCRSLSPAAAPPTAQNLKHAKRTLLQKKKHEPTLEALLDLPCDSEVTVRNRILSIVGYLSLIQQK
jgi:hypothetical protein